MRVAVLISGRLKCYERCLIPLLESSDYDIDLFISINAERDDYHNQALNNLLKWLKGEYICPYVIPYHYKDIFINMNSGTIVYGNRIVMDTYTKTYEYCLELNELWKGLYPIAFEPSVTQNVYDKGLEVKYFSASYTIDPSRHQ
jgi:hypothetical protein